MTIKALEVAIFAFCQFSNHSIPFEMRKTCMEKVLNCTISGTDDGSSADENKFNSCKVQWNKSYKNMYGDDYGL